MKLNLDCIRAILLCVEEHSAPNKRPLRFVDTERNSQLSQLLDNTIPLQDHQQKLQETYSNAELIYHLIYCIEADLLVTNDYRGAHDFLISDLSVKGHDFIGNIRYGQIYKGVKKITDKLGVQDLLSLTKIAQGVMNKFISEELQTF